MGSATIYFTARNLVFGLINQVNQTSYKATPTSYTFIEPSPVFAIFVFMLNYLGLILGCALLTKSMSRRPVMIAIIAAGVTMFIPVLLVGSFGFATIPKKAAAPDYLSPSDWLAKNYQIRNAELPYLSGTFSGVSDSGLKYKFRYTDTDDTTSIQELSAVAG